MRKSLVRAGLIGFISALGIVGADSLQLDGFDASWQPNEASARFKLDPTPCNEKHVGGCVPGDMWGFIVP
jgi:hypothetical protein